MLDAPLTTLVTRLKTVAAITSLLAAILLEPAGAQSFRMKMGCPNNGRIKIDNLPADITAEQWKKTLDLRCPGWDKASKPEPQPVGPPKVKIEVQRTFKMFDAADLMGGDLGDPIKNVTYRSCINACEKDNKCIGFAYDKFNSYCFLKSEVTGTIRYDPACLLGLVSDAKVTASSRQKVIERFRDTIFYDKAYSELRSITFEACEETCMGDDRCEAFSFIKATKVCKLIKSPNEYCRQTPRVASQYCRDRTYISADSGVKRQPEN